MWLGSLKTIPANASPCSTCIANKNYDLGRVYFFKSSSFSAYFLVSYKCSTV